MAINETLAHCCLDRDVAKLKATLCCRAEIYKRSLSPWRAAPQGSTPTQSNRTTSCAPFKLELVFLEVNSGFCVRLRGFDETWPAVLRGRCKTTKCTHCSTSLGSLPDVEFVLCPECRFISLAGNKVCYEGGGLGLGINIELVKASHL